MKILIATMHRGYNFGSALQIYALSEYLRSQKHIPIVLDYIPKRINFKSNIQHLIKDFFQLKSSIHSKYITLRAIIIYITNEYQYNKFFNNNILLTSKYFSLEEIQDNCPKADIYMTGSDQVWNSNHNQGIDKVFFLSFTQDNAKRIAYAASFGKQELEEWEIEETKRLLKRYYAISVRESSALKILQSVDIENGQHVLDPTLLLSKEQWIKRCPRLNIKEKYLLIYTVEPNKKKLIEYAKLIAKELNLKIYLVEWGFKKQPGVDKMIGNISPLTLMSYFNQAEYIIASSFHGTAFAVNLNKQFISVAPAQFSSRAKSLLKLIKLEDRFITNKALNLPHILSNINYTNVNAILKEQRNLSSLFLYHTIN